MRNDTDTTQWTRRWEENRIRFHQPNGHPALKHYWPLVADTNAQAVLVPLAGKTPDMRWLAAQGHPVLGIELSEIAVKAFFDEHHLTPTVIPTQAGPCYQSGMISLLCADFFDVDLSITSLLGFDGAFDFLYDRAALIALPPDLRKHYMAHLATLLGSSVKGLLITLDFPAKERDHPPYPVGEDEVIHTFGDFCSPHQVLSNDLMQDDANFNNDSMAWAFEHVYFLRPRDSS